MKNLFKSFVVMLAAALLIIACGGGSDSGSGGGSAGPVAPPSTGALKVNGDTSGLYEHHRMAFNSAGTTGIAVWHVENGYNYEVLYSVYSGSSWSDEVQLTSMGSYPDAATNGTSFMIVYEREGSIYACNFDGTTMGSETSVESESMHAYDPVIAARGATGEYAVAWKQWNSNNYALYANVYNGTSWGTAARIDAVDNYINNHHIASNGAGYAFIWLQSDGTKNNVYANIFNGSAWSGPVDIDAGTSYNAESPAIASNGSTYAVTWAQHDGSSNNIYTRIFNGTWGVVTLLESSTNSAGSPAIASNGSGYAAAWYQYDGSGYSIFVNIYNGSWGGPAAIESTNNYASQPSIASNGTYYAVAWYQYDDTNYNIYANIYSISSWGTPTLLENSDRQARNQLIAKKGSHYIAAWEQIDTSGNSNIIASAYNGAAWSAETGLAVNLHKGTCEYYRLATNAAGVSLAVWRQYNNGVYYTYTNVNKNGTWGTPLKLAGDADANSYSYSCSVATNGTVFMVVYELNGDIYARTFDGSAWGAEQGLETGDPNPPYTNYSSYEPAVASNGAGFAVVWYMYDPSTPSIYGSIYNGTAWSAKTLIESQTGYSYSPVVASNSSGYIIVWTQNDGSYYSVYASIYNGSSLGTETKLGPDSDYLYSPAVASNGSGYAVVWNQQDGTDYNLYANIYNGSSWSGSDIIDNGDTYVDYLPSIAAYGAGYIASWSQYSGSNYDNNIYVKFYNGTSWSTEDEIDIGSLPSVASNSSECGLVWTKYDSSYYNIYMSIYNGSIWETPSLVETIDSDANMPLISTNGNKFSAIWRQQTGLVWDIYVKLGF